MNVGELMRQLKRFSKTAEVVFQNHDQDDDTFEGIVRNVEEASDAMIERVSTEYRLRRGVVVLRP